jgi:FHS family L-fucose permease-like MFS transporter
VRAPYLLLAGFTFLLAVVTLFVRLPELIEKRPEGTTGEGSALQFVHLRLGAVAIFSYVGAEVAIGSILISFLGQPAMGSLSHQAAAGYVSLYWMGAMIGRFIGSFALLYIRAQRALAVVAVSAFVLVATTILGHGPVAMWAIVACGICNSVMWPCIFPLSVKGLGRFTSQGSGILITMVVGGAVIPEVQGLLADTFGYQRSFAVVLLCYAYLIYFALSGYRIRQPRFPSLPDFVPPLEGI